MSVQATGGASVLVLGRSAEVLESLAEALRRDGVAVVHTDSRSQATTLADANSDSMETIVVVVDRPLLGALLRDGPTGASRRQLRTWGNETADWAITTAISAGVRRLVLVCDARGLTFGQRMRAISWLRRLAHRIGYECRINGADGFATAEAVIDTNADVDATAEAVVAWHRDEGTSSNPFSARPPARPPAAPAPI
ncbi:hypothetical protein ACAG25_08110 [Mycobacterium sp. pV006]|uniref:hypothetical protein n=1 Tax=Mycobacterium sp. pV006 TaxID=3238983 RepID=UPI00351B7E40